MVTEHKLLIGGRLVDGDLTLDVIDPATEQVFKTVPRASETQLEEAVAAARAAFPGWSQTSLEVRRDCVVRLADALDADRENVARNLVREQGKRLSEARDEVDWTSGFMRAYAALDVPVEVVHEDETHRMEAHHSALGVVVGIAPWNFPLFLGTLKLTAAVLAGNSFILKPAPTTPITSLMIGEMAHGIFPAGVVNVLTDANELGARLSQHPDIAMVSFTGSTETGKKVASSAASTLKRMSLELGGNDASIVLDDADIETVAPKIFDAAFLCSGQVCVAIKRVYAHSAVYDRLCDALAGLAKGAVVGNGLEQGVRIGPLQNRMQFEKAKRFLEIAHRDGQVIAGGAAVDGDGYFIKPTIVRDIGHDSELVNDEQFAPILPVIRFDDSDEAIRHANNSSYGLGGSVWSANLGRAYDVAKKVRSGTVWINHHLHLHPSVPLGGIKQSGHGFDYGVEGLKEYTQITMIRIKK